MIQLFLVHHQIEWITEGEDRILQYHAEKFSHHKGTYFKVSYGKTGIIRINIG